MKLSDLKKADFLLGIEENWDTYIEVIVKFIETVSIDDHIYYLFVDKGNNQSFYLYPRYKGQYIEDALAKKQVAVNVSKMILNNGAQKSQLPLTYATGLLQLFSAES
jgi:hypothetical protein